MNSMTSLLAEQSIAPVKKSMRQQVFEFIKEQGKRGATDEEIETALNMKHQTVAPRRLELERQNRIIVGPEMRMTTSGRKAFTWVALV